jgi:hypothetical protein
VKEPAFTIIEFLLAVVITFCLSFFFGFGCAYEHMKKQAVKEGVAEFYIDDAGDKSFRYKKP